MANSLKSLIEKIGNSGNIMNAITDSGVSETDVAPSVSSSNFLGESISDFIEVHYTNNTDEGSFGKYQLNDPKLSDVINYAKAILNSNGISNLKFKKRDVSFAKKYTSGTKGVAFIAFVAKGWDYGNSDRRAKNGAVAVYDLDTKDSDFKTWLSWVDVRSITEDSTKFPDPIYAVGFSMAHEILHQLLYFASTVLDKDPLKFEHNNTVKNLNMWGKYSEFGYPLKKGSHEKIIQEQKDYLNRYFEHLRTNGGF
jgi:hypothetical protein